MEWMVYLIGGIAIAGVALALYERRKNVRMTYDAPPVEEPLSDRAAHQRAAILSAEGHFGNPPNGGGV